jgi:hypothetical protein
MSFTGDLKLKMCRQTVAAAGTPNKLITDPVNPKDWKCIALRIRAYKTNTGNIYVGTQGSLVTATDYSDILAPGEVWTVRISNEDRKWERFIDMTHIWLDADTTGNGVSYTALMEQEPMA